MQANADPFAVMSAGCDRFVAQDATEIRGIR
jgi:hypothetical protein